MTPNKCFYRKKPNVPFLMMFDIIAYARIIDEMLAKKDSKIEISFFLTIHSSRKGATIMALPPINFMQVLI